MVFNMKFGNMQNVPVLILIPEHFCYNIIDTLSYKICDKSYDNLCDIVYYIIYDKSCDKIYYIVYNKIYDIYCLIPQNSHLKSALML